jgi:hypothetical protein
MDTHREWRPVLQLEEKQEDSIWKCRLKEAVKSKESEMIQIILEELIL